MTDSISTDPIVYARPAAAKMLSISIRKLDDLIAMKKIRPTRIGAGADTCRRNPAQKEESYDY